MTCICETCKTELTPHEIYTHVCLSDTQAEIQNQCDTIARFLIDKNRKYGNSALQPMRVFSSASPEEAMLVRMDDKLSRIKNRQDDDDEDPILDLIGYLVLYLVHKKQTV